MEVEGSLFKSMSSNKAVPQSSTAKKIRNLSTGDVGHKMENKRRGVYVWKWVNPKQAAQDNKKSKPKAQPPPRPQINKLLTSAPKESNISTFTRLLGTPDPAVRFIKRKKRTLPEKLPKQSSKISKTSKESNRDKPRNIVEENKNLSKFRQNHPKDEEKTQRKVLQTPSTSSKINRDMSFDTNWSTIFPAKENRDTNLLQQYISNYDTGKDKKAKSTGVETKKKDEEIYTFFKDLIESVYDEEVATNPDVSAASSDVKFELDDPVAQKLQEYNSRQYTIDDKNYVYDQSRELADYYNNKLRLTPHKNTKRKKKNIRYTFTDKSENPKADNRLKKPNLLAVLKQELSMDLSRQEEPESMYEALLNIAKNKRKKKQIYFETTKESSDLERVCRFKGRSVISPSTRMPKRVKPASRCDSKTTRGVRTGSLSSIEESSHSLEVLGFDYDFLEPKMEPSELETAISRIRSITNLNEGISTVSHYWK
ncbi:uncharacterized protein LOC125239290 [Leguminivora glycinivorella]|uniref:uncharacterized protein LOC125239290 n=1 Tax=Leguminivora glycinivorella TaxID=1035111 RepID=UPI00200D0F3E|nr:uncharacterized protein LOC125239290 [Leguminivora glycinivorella]